MRYSSTITVAGTTLVVTRLPRKLTAEFTFPDDTKEPALWPTNDDLLTMLRETLYTPWWHISDKVLPLLLWA